MVEKKGSSVSSKGDKVQKTKKKSKVKWSFGAPKNVVLQNSLYSSGVGSLTWQNLNESLCLASLPDPLRSLIHFKQLSREMVGRTSSTFHNRGTKKSIEIHGKTVDTAYLTALQNYIVSLDDEDKMEEERKKKKKEEEEEKMKDGNNDNDNDEDDEANTTTQEYHEEMTKKLFHRAGTMAFLYRYASSLEEQRVLNDEYRKHTAKYIIHIATNTTKPNSTAADDDDDEDEDEDEEDANSNDDDDEDGEEEEPHSEEEEKVTDEQEPVAAAAGGEEEEDVNVPDDAAVAANADVAATAVAVADPSTIATTDDDAFTEWTS